MKKLEIIIRPERLDDLKTILNSCNAHGLMITNIMGYGSQKGHKQAYNGVDFGGNLLPKVKVETIVDDDTAEKIIDLVIEEINTGLYGDGKIFVLRCLRLRFVSVPASAVLMHYSTFFNRIYLRLSTGIITDCFDRVIILFLYIIFVICIP